MLPQVLINEEVNPSAIGRKSLRELSQKSIASVDAATRASEFQLQEEHRELTYALISLFIKSGLFVIAIASLLNLGIASHQRINRNNEITSVLKLETEKLTRLHLRFDSLFSIGGKGRLMEEQDQWIAPKSRRIIWR